MWPGFMEESLEGNGVGLWVFAVTVNLSDQVGRFTNPISRP
jgi:hypothetical protein